MAKPLPPWQGPFSHSHASAAWGYAPSAKTTTVGSCTDEHSNRHRALRRMAGPRCTNVSGWLPPQGLMCQHSGLHGQPYTRSPCKANLIACTSQHHEALHPSSSLSPHLPCPAGRLQVHGSRHARPAGPTLPTSSHHAASGTYISALTRQSPALRQPPTPRGSLSCGRGAPSQEQRRHLVRLQRGASQR